MPEDQIKKLEDQIMSLSKQVTHMESSLMGISIHLDYLKDAEEKRKKLSSTIFMGFLGALISTVVAWVVGGGIASE